jgi:hypothetical protein
MDAVLPFDRLQPSERIVELVSGACDPPQAHPEKTGGETLRNR